MNIFWIIIAAILLLGPLVTVHEYGHFLLARMFGVKVIRFSIGFGSPLLKWTSKRSGTEYQIAWFPLGGFVKLLDCREAEVAEIELQYEFMHKAAWKRLLIVAAGPLFNLLFAILVYWVVFMQGEYQWRAVIADVPPVSVAAQAGILAGDEILEIDSKKMQDWNQAQREILTGALEKSQVVLKIQSLDGQLREVLLDLGAVDVAKHGDNYLFALGLVPIYVPPARIAQVVPEKSAAKAGLLAGDLFVAINDQPIYGWDDMQRLINSMPGENIIAAVLRQGELVVLPVEVFAAEVEEGKLVGRIGIQGDFADFYQEIIKYRVRVDFSVGGALTYAVKQTAQTSQMILRGLWSIVSGKASVKNISGPVRIADVAGKAMSHGWVPFLHMMAFVSISLAIVNFLPIPILDGGHILFYFIEMVKGSPVSERFFVVAQHFGLVILVVLMGVAFYNDFNWLIN